MREKRNLNQTIEILKKIIISFSIVFILYLISYLVNNFAFDYFIFPFISFIVVFVCGIHVGKGLEKMKCATYSGYSEKNDEDNKNDKTEFHVNDRVKIVTNKKIIKELENGEIVHVKTFNYNEINLEEEKDGESEGKE